MFPLVSQNTPDGVHVFGLPDEGGKHHVNALLHPKLEVTDVLLRDCREVNVFTREVDSLFGAQLSSILDL